MKALIIAFDGVLARSIAVRADAIIAAVQAEAPSREGLQTDRNALLEILPGRSIDEAVELGVPSPEDPVLTQLVAMRAQRIYSRRLAQGIDFDADILALITTRSADGWRIVLRSDSLRRDIEPQLSLAGIDHLLAFCRCSDDQAPHTSASATSHSSLEKSWLAIDTRLTSMHIASGNRESMESSSQTAAVAAAYSSPSEAATATKPQAPSPLNEHDLNCYQRAANGCIWFAPNLFISRITGPEACASLNGVITNDISKLEPGSAVYAAAVSSRGKMISDLLVVALETPAETPNEAPRGSGLAGRSGARSLSQYLVITGNHDANTEWLAMTQKYINPRLARVSDESSAWQVFCRYGSQHDQSLLSIGGSEGIGGSDGVGGREGIAEPADSQLRIIPLSSLLGLPAALLLSPVAIAEQVQSTLSSTLGPPASKSLAQVLRVEAGLPAMGLDMDNSTIPQEANLEELGAISYTKGCYTGQEVVARVHFRGHVNRRLMGLRSTRGPTDTIPLPPGATLVDKNGKTVGDVRSSVISPRLGPIALAMLRREIECGSTVFLHTEAAGQRELKVSDLPFPSLTGSNKANM